jgi:hypothetical protein
LGVRRINYRKRFSLKKNEGRRPLGKPRSGCEDVKMEIKEME